MPSPDEGVAPVSTNFGIDSRRHWRDNLSRIGCRRAARPRASVESLGRVDPRARAKRARPRSDEWARLVSWSSKISDVFAKRAETPSRALR